MRGLFFALASLLPAAASPPDERPVSLIVGQWRGESEVRGVPCPPDDICMNVIGDVRFGSVRTLAGPEVPHELTARFEFHAAVAPGYNLVLFVRPASGGRFDGLWVHPARQGRKICVEADALVVHAIPAPPNAQAQGDDLCFAPVARP